MKNSRVLFVVNEPQARVDRVREVCARVVPSVPKGIFWYITHDDLLKKGALNDIWLTGDGKRLDLV